MLVKCIGGSAMQMAMERGHPGWCESHCIGQPGHEAYRCYERLWALQRAKEKDGAESPPVPKDHAKNQPITS